MTRTLLVAFEESPEGEAAFHRALRIAQRDGGALHVVSVVQTIEIETNIAHDAEETRRKHELEPLLAQAAKLGISVTTQVPDGPAAAAIAEIARAKGASLIVIGHRHRGMLARLAASSVAKQVLDHTPCDVLVVTLMEGQSTSESA